LIIVWYKIFTIILFQNFVHCDFYINLGNDRVIGISCMMNLRVKYICLLLYS